MSSERNVTQTIRQGRWKVRRVSCIVQKFDELWSTNGFKRDRTFSPPSSFCSMPTHQTPSNQHQRGTPQRLLMKRHWICLQLRFEASKDVELKMLSRRAALSGNTSI